MPITRSLSQSLTTWPALKVPTALIGGFVALAALVPAASAQTNTSVCAGEGNRFTRFFGSSYIAKNQFCSLEREMLDQQAFVDQAQGKIGAIEGERDLGLARIASLEAELAGVGACQADEFQLALDNARMENIELLDSQDSLSSQIAGLDLQIEQLRSTIDSQENKLNLAMTGGEGLNVEISSLQAALKASETEALALRTERDNLQVSYETLGEKNRSDASRLGNELELSVGALAACRSDFDAFRATATETANTSGDLKGQLALARAEVTDLRSKIDAFEATEMNIRMEMDELNTELASAQSIAGQMPDTSLALDNANQMVASLEGELSAAREEASSMNLAMSADLNAAQAALADRDALIVDLQAQLAGLTTERDANLGSLQQRVADLSEEASQVPALMSDLKNRDIQILDLEADLNEQRKASVSRVADLRADISGLNRTIDTLEAQVAAAGDGAQQMGNLQSLVGKRDSDLERAQSALNDSLSVKANLEGELRDRDLSLQTTEALLSSAQQEVKELKAGITDVRMNAQSNSAEAKATIADLKAQLDAAKMSDMNNGELSAQLAASNAEIDGLRSALRASGPNAVSGELNSALRRWMERSRTDRSKGLFLDGDKLVLSSGVSLFQPGSARLSEGGEAMLTDMAADLKSAIAELPEGETWQLQVLGHADATPSGSRWPSNWELSSFRAATVVRTLVDQGLPADRLSAVGMGEFHPLVDEATPEAYAKNRRIELMFR